MGYFTRGSGLLLPFFSLSSKQGCGSFGDEANDFIEFLASAKQKYWQILPLNPAGLGNSPYMSYSTFAGSEVYIDLLTLEKDGYLPRGSVKIPESYAQKVDYYRAQQNISAALDRAFALNLPQSEPEYCSFCQDNAAWLDDYALFWALKKHFSGADWHEWPSDIAGFEKDAVCAWRENLRDDVERCRFGQFIFFKQWQAVRRLANESGIKIIGDLPIYVAADSADVWSQSRFFQLDESGRPAQLAGVPPDYFNKDGQLWGNPLYDWQRMQQDGYGWWIRRVAKAQQMFDAVRLDHFRGFSAYWSVPAGSATARDGCWRQGPGTDFIKMLCEWFSDIRFIAEDLGRSDGGVREMLDSTGLPGMRVLEFAFDSDAANPYLPHNYPRNCVCYTGTHDNAPLLQWAQQNRKKAKAAGEYFNDRSELNWSFIRSGSASVADVFIAQMPDVLDLGAQGRINRPGTAAGNWNWMMAPGAANGELAKKLRGISECYGR